MVSRETVLAAARATIGATIDGTPAAPIVITGLRGMGKTVLLRRIEDESDKKRCIPILIEGVPGKRFEDALRSAITKALDGIASIAQRLGKAVGAAIDALPGFVYDFPHDGGSVKIDRSAKKAQSSEDNFSAMIAGLNRRCEVVQVRLVILIDEVQEVDVDSLRAVLTTVHASMSTNSPIALIVAGLPESVFHLKKARSYAERFTNYRLELVPEDAAAIAFRVPLQRAGAIIEPDALDLLVKKSLGYPFFIQVYGAAAWAERKSLTISIADVRRAIVQADQQADELYRARIADLTEREMAIVKELANLGPRSVRVREVASATHSTTRQLGSTLQQLTLKGITFSPGYGQIKFALPGFDDYVRRHSADFG